MRKIIVGALDSPSKREMRKAFAIQYVTHDGVMQSPGAFQ
jgi:hypothetical protein